MLRHLATVGPSKVGRCRRHGGDVGVGPDEVEILVLLDQGQALEVEVFGNLGHGSGRRGRGGRRMIIGIRRLVRDVGSGPSTGRIKGGRYGQLGRERSKALQPRWGEGGSIDGTGIVGIVGGVILPDRTQPIGKNLYGLHGLVDGGRPRTGGPGGAGGHGIHLALDAGRIEYLRGGDGRLRGIGSLGGGVAQTLQLLMKGRQRRCRCGRGCRRWLLGWLLLLGCCSFVVIRLVVVVVLTRTWQWTRTRA